MRYVTITLVFAMCRKLSSDQLAIIITELEKCADKLERNIDNHLDRRGPKLWLRRMATKKK